MTVFSVVTYFVKPEKRQEFMSFWQRWFKYVKDNPETFKELKSVKLFTQMYGGIYGGYVEMWEFDNLEELAKHMAKWASDKGLKEIEKEWSCFSEQATQNIWSAIE
jgi:hypothetical protein